jgi:hypothetical protein
MVSKRGKILLILVLGYVLCSIAVLANGSILGFLLLNLLYILIWVIVKKRLTERRYGVRSITQNGEEVKSMGEKRIADYLYTNGITYQYEKVVKTWAFGKSISKADFYLPDYKILVEYWGMVDVENRRTNSKYIRTMKWKMAMYYKHRIKFISIYPSNLNNLDRIFRKKFKEITGEDVSPRPLEP